MGAGLTMIQEIFPEYIPATDDDSIAHVAARMDREQMRRETRARVIADVVPPKYRDVTLASLDPEGMPSMAQDRINEKPTEVEEFSGTVIRLAEKHGLLVPTNRWLHGRIRELEAGFGA